jgi:hypothetical protein
MATKGKRILLWLIVVFVGFPVLLGVVGVFAGGETENAVDDCTVASQEDIENISTGMSDKSLSVGSGFVSQLTTQDIEKVTEIFPSYTNPRIIGAPIIGVDGVNPVGLWAIQDIGTSGTLRITALNDDARKYSVWGSVASDGSPADNLRKQLLVSSENTNLKGCLERN